MRSRVGIAPAAADDVEPVVVAAAVAVAVDGEHARLDLREAVDDAPHPKSGEQLDQIAPRLAQAEAIDGLDDVGQVRDDASPGPIPSRAAPPQHAASPRGARPGRLRERAELGRVPDYDPSGRGHGRRARRS